MKTGFHLQVFPREAGDFGFGYMSGIHYTERELVELAETMSAEIRRHVNSVHSVHVVWETDEPVEAVHE